MHLEGMSGRIIKPYLVAMALLFAVSFFSGTSVSTSFGRQMSEVFQEVVGGYQGLAGGALFFNILVTNVMATIFVLVSGVIGGIVPVFAVGSNGFGLGVLFRQAAETSGYSAAALKILPYGVFEIPALLVAASYGVWLGGIAVRKWRGKEDTLLRFPLEHAFRRYFAVVFPLLVLGAGAETAFILRAAIAG
jgi:stage II sporulation protein M